MVLGLEAGAVDYVVKPFRLAELLARIASHLRYAAHVDVERRRAGRAAIGSAISSSTAAPRRVTIGDDEVALRPKEFDVLARLAQRRRAGRHARAADRRRVGRELVGVDEDRSTCTSTRSVASSVSRPGSRAAS